MHSSSTLTRVLYRDSARQKCIYYYYYLKKYYYYYYLCCSLCEMPQLKIDLLHTVTPVPEGGATAPTPGVCVRQWSDWINRDDPSGDGDSERLTLEEMTQLCPGQ